MSTEREELLVTTRRGEPRGVWVTEETFGSDGLVLAVSGELDIATAPALRDRLTAAIDAGKLRLVIDLSAVSFLDSVALATIVHAKRRLPADAKLAVVIDPSSYVMLIFRSAGLAKVLELVETRSQAIDVVSG